MDQGRLSGSGSRLGALRVWAEKENPDSETRRRPTLLWQLVNAQKPDWLLARAPVQDAADVRVRTR